MTPAARERWLARVPLLSISACAWILLLLAPDGMALHTHCSMATMDRTPTSITSLLTSNTGASLAIGWLLMLAAMMAPTLTPVVCHVRDRSFARRRPRAIALFAAGYIGVWMVCGVLLSWLVLAMQSILPIPYGPLALIALVAFVWQFSPFKQRCLNRCHAHPSLAAFGLAADLDALRLGLKHGIWCVGSCWALMLLPMMVPFGNLAAMAFVTLWIISERLDTPTRPRWRWHGPGKALRIAWAQARLRLQMA
jgi:predicted metal-binding membrane protein